MNWRIKPLDDIIATAEKKSLKRSLGAFQLTMMGIGAIIGTGIFVLTAEAAQKAGPGMMVSFIVAGFVNGIETELARFEHSPQAVIAERHQAATSILERYSPAAESAACVSCWQQFFQPNHDA